MNQPSKLYIIFIFSLLSLSALWGSQPQTTRNNGWITTEWKNQAQTASASAWITATLPREPFMPATVIPPLNSSIASIGAADIFPMSSVNSKIFIHPARLAMISGLQITNALAQEKNTQEATPPTTTLPAIGASAITAATLQNERHTSPLSVSKKRSRSSLHEETNHASSTNSLNEDRATQLIEIQSKTALAQKKAADDIYQFTDERVKKLMTDNLSLPKHRYSELKDWYIKSFKKLYPSASPQEQKKLHDLIAHDASTEKEINELFAQKSKAYEAHSLNKIKIKKFAEECVSDLEESDIALPQNEYAALKKFYDSAKTIRKQASHNNGSSRQKKRRKIQSNETPAGAGSETATNAAQMPLTEADCSLISETLSKALQLCDQLRTN